MAPLPGGDPPYSFSMVFRAFLIIKYKRSFKPSSNYIVPELSLQPAASLLPVRVDMPVEW